MNAIGRCHQSSIALRWISIAVLAAAAGLFVVRVVAPWMNSLPLSVVASMCGHNVCLPIDVRSIQGEQVNSPASKRSR